MNYIDHIARCIAERCSMDWQDLEQMKLARHYAVLSLAKGRQTTLEDVHNAWAAWRSAHVPNHKSLVMFSALTVEVQELDRPYMEAIHAVSFPWERPPPTPWPGSNPNKANP